MNDTTPDVAPEAGATPAAAPAPAARPAPPPPVRPRIQRAGPLRWVVRLGVLAALIGGGVLLRKTVFAPAPIEVRVAVVERGAVESSVTNSRAGTVRARRRARLSPETGGRVVELPFRKGDRVTQGAVLMRLDDATPRAQLAAAKQAVLVAEARQQEAEATAVRAEKELARNQSLARTGIVTPDQIELLQSRADAARAAVASAAAAIEQARAGVKVTEAELAKYTLVAPFSGILAELSAELGEWVTPSPPALPVPSVIDLLDPTSIYVSAPMDEVDSAVIQAGLTARASLDPFPGRSFPARVVRVAAFVLDVEAQNRTVEVEVELNDPSQAARLLPGTSADVEIVLATHPGVLRVPAAALIEGKRVLVVEEGGVLASRAVKVGIKNWDFAEVLEGLREGERVVVSLGQQGLEPGAVVAVTSGAATR